MKTSKMNIFEYEVTLDFSLPVKVERLTNWAHIGFIKIEWKPLYKYTIEEIQEAVRIIKNDCLFGIQIFTNNPIVRNFSLDWIELVLNDISMAEKYAENTK